MRTVDPELWSKKIKRRSLDLSRPCRFGQPARGGLEGRLRGALADAARELWRNCSVQGVRHLVDENVTKIDKYRWLLLIAVFFCFGMFVEVRETYEFMNHSPLQVSLQSSQHSIQRVPFPAIALCSYNVISNRALDDYTKYLVTKDLNRTFSSSWIRRNLLNFGSLLTLALRPVRQRFMDFLDDLHSPLNVTHVMYKLSPRCSSLLLKCTWRGRAIPCDRLFAKRLTSLGFCCVFNSRYQDSDINNPPKVLDLVGQNRGLAVVMKEDSDDFAFLRRPGVGIEMLMFEGSEYPLLEGGAVRAILAPRNCSVFLTLTTRVQLTAPSLHYYSEDWRGCRLQQPRPRDMRSYSWCLTECRRRAALELCGCVPYTLQAHGDLVCTPHHLSCLNKHREKFLYYYPYGFELESLSEELQDALYCGDCLPDCARSVFHATAYNSDYKHVSNYGKLFLNRLTYGLKTLANVTVVRLFYTTADQHLYLVESGLDFYETFASITSQWFTLLGVTLVSFAEVVFFFTVRWRHHYRRRTRIAANNNRKITPLIIYKY